jgi:hypothetical protein
LEGSILLAPVGGGIPAIIDLLSVIFNEEGDAQTVECPQPGSDSYV